MSARLFLTLSLVSFAMPALALSCLRPDVTDAFATAQKSEQSYLVVTGTLVFDQAALPEAVGNESPDSTRLPAKFSGKLLTRTGFDQPFDQDVTLEVRCLGPWCGGARTDQTYLAFLKAENGGYVLVADPCQTMLFPDPTPKTLNTAKACARKNSCPG